MMDFIRKLIGLNIFRHGRILWNKRKKWELIPYIKGSHRVSIYPKTDDKQS